MQLKLLVDEAGRKLRGHQARVDFEEEAARISARGPAEGDALNADNGPAFERAIQLCLEGAAPENDAERMALRRWRG